MAAGKDDALKISSYRVCAARAKVPVSCSMRPMKEMATRGHASKQLTVLEEIEEAKAHLKNSREPETPN